MEAAGLVLGILPIAIKTLQQYKTILSAYKSAAQRLGNLEQDLVGELHIFTSTFETLLIGVVPDFQLVPMLQDPFGPQWKDEYLNNGIRRRLGSSYYFVEAEMKRLGDSMIELKAKLAINQDLKSNLTTIRAIRGALFQKTVSNLVQFGTKITFTLDYKDYQELLVDIKSVNFRLSTLVQRGKELEPSRQRRYHWRFTNLLRDFHRSLFKALNGATAICCNNPHATCLRLGYRDLDRSPDDAGDRIRKDLTFHVVLGLYTDTETSSNSDRPTSEWYSLQINIAEDHSQGSSIQDPLSEPKKLRQRLTKRTKTTAALVLESLKPMLKPKAQPESIAQSRSGVKLCDMVRKQGLSPEPACGFIEDQEIQRCFGLYAPVPSMAPQSSTSFTLRQMLQQPPPNIRSQDSFSYPRVVHLGFEGKLRLAEILAINVLDLYNTPWLSTTITLDDIKFRPVNEGPSDTPPSSWDPDSFGPRFPYIPFISKVMPSSMSDPPGTTSSNDAESQQKSPLRETTSWSFGLIMIQLMLERVIDELDINPEQQQQSTTTSTTTRTTTTTTFRECQAKSQRGEKYDSEVFEAAGGECASAVMWCLKSFSYTGGLYNKEYNEEFCAQVIFKLREALKRVRRIVL